MVIALDRSTSMNQPFVPDSQTQFQAAVQALGQSVDFYSTAKQATAPSAPDDSFFVPGLSGRRTRAAQRRRAAAPSDVSRVCGFRTSLNALTRAVPRCGMLEQRSPPHRGGADEGGPMGRQHDAAAAAGTSFWSRTAPPSGNCVTMYDDCTNAEQQAMNITKDTNHQPTVLRIGGIAAGSRLPDLPGRRAELAFYFAGADYGGLSRAVADIMSYAVCEVTLTPRCPSSQTNQLQVTSVARAINTTRHTRGWTYSPNSGRLRLHGAACDATRSACDLHMLSRGCETGRGGTGFQP